MSLNYSVVLRTLGYGGEKYQALLDSIKSQTIQPMEFIVVIPPEYELPKERLGTETFIRGPKGMVRQRVDGINAAKGDYLLIVDDDVSFPAAFVEELWKLMQKSNADAISPRVDDTAAPMKTGMLHRVLSWLSSGARESRADSPYALRISALGGTICTTPLEKDRTYYTQTGHGGCCFIRREAALRLRYQEESWLEEGVRYAYPDDSAFFYKSYCLGLRTVFAHNHPFRHLNAASTMGELKERIQRSCTIKHDSCRNLVIFLAPFSIFSSGKKRFLCAA